MDDADQKLISNVVTMGAVIAAFYAVVYKNLSGILDHTHAMEAADTLTDMALDKAIHAFMQSDVGKGITNDALMASLLSSVKGSA